MRDIVMLMGMPRAATTFLYHHFDSHPDIFVPFRRKTNYFSLHFNRKSSDWFFHHFESATRNQICVDTETIGFVDKNIDVLARIEQVLDENCKFIVCIRDPGEWVYSLYKQILTFDTSGIAFETFLQGGYQLIEDNSRVSFNYKNGDIKSRIKLLIENFGPRLLLLDYKEIQQDPNKVLIKIERFLDISGYYKNNPISTEKINASDKKNVRLVTCLLRNKYLIKLLGRLPSNWVKAIRKFYDTRLTRNPESVKKTVEPKEVLLGRVFFKDDVKFYHELFSILKG